MHVLPLGSDEFGHVLGVELQKMGHLSLVAASMELLSHCSGNFGSNPFLGKFLDFVGEKHQQPSGNTGLYMCVLPTISMRY